jgi:hypothetical protein
MTAPRLAVAERLAQLAPLDRPAQAAGQQIRGLLPRGAARDALAGTWLGHALHPALTDVVIGTWMSATLLDLTGGEARDARRLIGLGALAALPTAATGATDWADSEAVDDGVRRVGAVHAMANTAALALQVASWSARRRGRTGRGKALSLLATGGMFASAYLGGTSASSAASASRRPSSTPGRRSGRPRSPPATSPRGSRRPSTSATPRCC